MSLIKFNGNKPAINGFSDVFESVFNDSFFSDRLIARVPAVNVAETADGYHIEMAAPGLSKEDFHIQLDRKLLTISVEKQQSEKSDRESYSRREFSYTSFVRSFALPDSADDSNIEASYANGILDIRVAKKEEAKQMTRRIEIS
ncbi:Hsp20/alpha crystallin family protein [Pedobacter yulinensis]|uniref:Hsp20/alpha crystallin family protein n=1 Tax=Pedobacter yulinensis TaxID=2126353 RepID=A0A2T3HK75_9SPHI|nr:Hsp20/alpha crystallin family protein [Pedobacter yulinensis]PST82836.1 Hsp20/alpha crystallin family protein [Pedobacter yulinensis]